MFIRRRVALVFIVFLIIWIDRKSGLQQSSARTGFPMIVHGYVASTSILERKVTIPWPQTTYLQFSHKLKAPLRRNWKEML